MTESKKNKLNLAYFTYVYGEMTSLLYELSVSSEHYRNFGFSQRNIDVIKIIRSGIRDVESFLRRDDEIINKGAVKKASDLTISLQNLAEKYDLENMFEDLFISGVRDIIFSNIIQGKDVAFISKGYDYIFTLIVESLIIKRFAFVDYFNKHLFNNSFLFGDIKLLYIFYSAYLFSLTKIDYVDTDIKKFILEMASVENGKWKSRLKENIRLMSVDDLSNLLLKMMYIFKCHHGVWCWPYHEDMYTVSEYEMSLEFIFNVWLDIVRYHSLFNNTNDDIAKQKAINVFESIKTDPVSLEIFYRCINEKFDNPDIASKKTASGYIEFIFGSNYESSEFQKSNMIRTLLDLMEAKSKEKCISNDYNNELAEANPILLAQVRSAVEQLGFGTFDVNKTCVETSIHFLLDLDSIHDSGTAYKSFFENHIVSTVSSMVRHRVKDNLFTKQIFEDKAGDFIFTASAKYALLNYGFNFSKVFGLNIDDSKKYISQARIAFKENSIDFGVKIDNNSLKKYELEDAAINNIIEGTYKTAPGVYKYYKYQGSIERFSCSYDEIYSLVKNRYRNVTLKVSFSINSFETKDIYFIKNSEE